MNFGRKKAFEIKQALLELSQIWTFFLFVLFYSQIWSVICFMYSEFVLFNVFWMWPPLLHLKILEWIHTVIFIRSKLWDKQNRDFKYYSYLYKWPARLPLEVYSCKGISRLYMQAVRLVNWTACRRCCAQTLSFKYPRIFLEATVRVMLMMVMEAFSNNICTPAQCLDEINGKWDVSSMSLTAQCNYQKHPWLTSLKTAVEEKKEMKKQK